MKVTIPAAYVIRKPDVPNKIGFQYHPDFEPAIKGLVSDMKNKNMEQLAVEIKLPFRPRSKGYRSQNSHIHGHCKDLSLQLKTESGELAYTPEEIKEAMKRIAVKDGYPTKYSPIDDAVIPKPSRYASSEEANLLIEVMHRFADEHMMWLTEYDEQGNPQKMVGGAPVTEPEDA